MKRCLSTLILVPFAVSCFAADLKAEVEALNKKAEKLLKAKDLDGFAKMLKTHCAPDFKYCEEGMGGKPMTLQQMMDQMKMGYAMTDTVKSVSAKILTLNVTGNTAKGTTRHEMTSVMKGEKGKKGPVMVYIGKSTDMYKMIKGKWYMTSMSMKTEKMTLDGKPFDPSKMGGTPAGK